MTGGIDLASEWAGFESVGQCEFADYPTKVLEKHWPEVPRWRDIRDVTLESVRSKGIRSVDLISGGFPCQPFSVAGKQRGKEDDRYLWPEMLRVISELKPTWVIGENVSGFTGLVQFKETPAVDEKGNAIGEVGELFNRTGRYIPDEILESLEEIGYEVQAFIIPACAVDAPHQRKRVFIVGYSQHDGLPTSEVTGSITETSNWEQERQDKTSQSEGASRPRSSCYVANPKGKSSSTNFDGETGPTEQREPRGSGCSIGIDRWPTEPDVGRMANGISFRVERLKCLGNAVVPAQVYPILQAIADIERSQSNG